MASFCVNQRLSREGYPSARTSFETIPEKHLLWYPIFDVASRDSERHNASGDWECVQRVLLTLEQLACDLLIRLDHDAVIFASVGTIIVRYSGMSSRGIRCELVSVSVLTGTG
jgi:hypothetical protein